MNTRLLGIVSCIKCKFLFYSQYDHECPNGCFKLKDGELKKEE